MPGKFPRERRPGIELAEADGGHMSCADELALGQSSYACGDLLKAWVHFSRAHSACHEDKALHQAAHQGLFRVALHRGKIGEAMKQFALSVLTRLFD